MKKLIVKRSAVIVMVLAMMLGSSFSTFAYEGEPVSEATTVENLDSDNQEKNEEKPVEQAKNNEKASSPVSKEANEPEDAPRIIRPLTPKSEYTKKDFSIIYEKEKVTLTSMPVIDAKTGAPIDKTIKYRFWNATLQKYEKVATSVNGLLEDVDMIRGHRYIVYAEDTEYNFKNNAYLILNETGNKPINDRAKKSGTLMTSFELVKREAPVKDPADSNRVDVELELWHWDNDWEDFSDDSYEWATKGTTLVFSSPHDVVKVPISDAYLKVRLIEDCTYVVSAEGGSLSTYPYPLTVKDHSERNAPKLPYNHLSCGGRSEIVLFDKGEDIENESLTTLTSVSGKTVIGGWNFHSKNLIWGRMFYNDTTRFAIDENNLEKTLAKGIVGDFSVFEINAINMARIELSRLLTPYTAKIPFNITTSVETGKTVSKVSYINDSGRLVSVPFVQEGDKVGFNMNTLSVYPIVIQYKGTANDDYILVSDNNLSWDLESDKNLEFVFKTDGDDDKSFENFSGLELDGELLDVENYTLKKGSVIVELKPEFLNTLSEGDHTLKAFFEGGTKSASSQFTIQPRQAVVEPEVEPEVKPEVKPEVGPIDNSEKETVALIKSKEVNALDSKINKDKVSASASGVVQTGETNQIMIYVITMIITASLGAALMIMRGRGRQAK